MEICRPEQRPLRRDAERNRQRILAAARTLIAEQGLGVSHDQLAEAADVAVGTVYRRFPDKESLIGALFAEQIDDIIVQTGAALEIADPWEAMIYFMTTSVQIHADNRGLMELALGTTPDLAPFREASAKITPVVEELVARLQAAGVLRPGVGVNDFALVPIMIGAIIDSAREVDENLWRRMLALVLDGFRAQDAPPLPCRTPSTEEMLQIKCGWRPPGATRSGLSRSSSR